jgi:preprotein translocase subunit SecA
LSSLLSQKLFLVVDSIILDFALKFTVNSLMIGGYFMLGYFLKKFFGSRNERVLKRLQKVVVQINQLEPEYQRLTDAELQGKTAEFKQRLAEGALLDSLLPEAFAAVREASVRTLQLRHFDVQLIGGMVLHEANIAEMLTGEGKTLVATLPVYLNSLNGNGVHIVTVNDYLAKRDAEWMGPIYRALGLTIGVNFTGMGHKEKQAAYAADVTFGTNNEFGFDFLRDNMAFSLEDRVQRGLHYAIVDEVDSILIDEARTPLIISGPAEDSSDLYRKINTMIPQLVKQDQEENFKETAEPQGDGDYYLEEKAKQVYLTEKGHQHVEEILAHAGLIQAGESLYDPANILLMHHVHSALRAHALFHRDVDYIVKDNQVVIVDEHTGRVMPGRRWSDGLHQAVEAKENVHIQNENQTLASITFQNYFRSYDKLAGMTGTADTEAFEFHQIYGLEVIAIPPNRAVIRQDYPDKVFLTQKEKFAAITEEIIACKKAGQPVLVGTASIETSEQLSHFLKDKKIAHYVLNAKHHEQEAQIIAQAGRPAAVTIATNMAGRGTDIVLGGNFEAELAELPADVHAEQKVALKQAWQQRHDEVVAAGGLHILGTERHESRRIDNQLRGRAGRQGDPGSSRFYLSLEDNLLRIFASDKMAAFMQRIGVPEGEALESAMLSRVIENAQRKVEAHNFDIRKQLLEFDDVANEQRKVVYAQRFEVMAEKNIAETIDSVFKNAIDKIIDQFVPPQSFPEQWNIDGLNQVLAKDFLLATIDVQQWLTQEENLVEEGLRERIHHLVRQQYEVKKQLLDAEHILKLEKAVLLHKLDLHWKEHLAAMDYLRHGIHLRYYAQKNPKQEYKREAFELFALMLDNIKYAVVTSLCHLRIEEPETEVQRMLPAAGDMQYIHEANNSLVPIEEASTMSQRELPQKATPFTREGAKVGRNQACPCGSGKKYKQCHGRLQTMA